MIGNSLRSDILPVVALGAHAIHVPYHLTWQHEHVDVPADARTWREMTDITAVANWLAQNY
jgi:putative hydrolase of the HAD superfamily